MKADNILALNNSSNSETIKYANIGRTKNSTLASGVNEESLLLSTNSSEACATTATHMGSTEMGKKCASSGPALSRFTANMSGNDSSSSNLEFEDVGAGDIIQMYNDGTGGYTILCQLRIKNVILASYFCLTKEIICSNSGFSDRLPRFAMT